MTATVGEPLTSGTAKKRLPRLDGIRGLCAVSVIFAHVAFATIVLSPEMGKPPDGIWSILAAGQLSIGPFFVLSGLLLYRPFVRMTLAGGPKPDIGSYFMRRLARMLPAFYLVTTCSLLLLNLSSLHGVWDVLRPYFLLHVYDYHWYAGLDVAWTVPTEMQFYLLLPVFAWIAHRMARRVDDPGKKAVRMLAPIILLLVVQFSWELYLHSTNTTWPTTYFYPFGIAGLLGAGMLLAIVSVLSETAPEKTPGWYRLASRHPGFYWLLALGTYLINCAQPFDTPGTAHFQAAPAALVRSALLLLSGVFLVLPLFPPDANNRFIEVVAGNPVSRYLGRISYGLYLWHFFVIYMVLKDGSVFGAPVAPIQAFLGQFGFWKLFLEALFGTIVVASLSFWVVERPIIRLVERRVRTRTARRAAANDTTSPAAIPGRVEPGYEDRSATRV